MSNMVKLFLAFAVIIVVSQSVFVVRETEQVLVVQFGEPKYAVRDAGLNFKIPFVQEARYLDKRLLNLDVPAQEVIASDQKRLVVDAIARFRIVNPLLTYQTQRTEAGARNQLGLLLSSNVRQTLGRQSFQTLLSGARVELMREIRDAVNTAAAVWGIEVVDVRIRRADLPEANSRAIYDRMNTEREREAREARALGQEQAVRIRSEADRDRTVILADARRQSAILRGEGDAEASRIFAQAFGQDENFYEFYRTMQAYRAALSSSDTTLVLSPDSEFFKYFEGLLDGGRN